MLSSSSNEKKTAWLISPGVPDVECLPCYSGHLFSKHPRVLLDVPQSVVVPREWVEGSQLLPSTMGIFS